MQLSLTLGVADLERTEDFYREILQLKPERNPAGTDGPDFLLLRCTGTSIVFRPLQILEAQHPALLQNLIRQTLGVGLQLELSSPDLSAIRLAIDRYGWPVVYELDDSEHQRSEIWLHDPDGYLLVLNEEQA
ncbi:Catechol 2,3-dioxygenase [Malonomonas rubra DSM 5091]|uniref:Catechol 2,3-dioxygenase n=1 Tax=Malonomonas rubra DSM 5091 TaxID=1122189 RepID=A0A1M6MDR2_MALRU|nr:VOC family protein [Malonomonas rubra]SHJ81587.1 Catechol 2,3-dioxygenase [Malonomonas rubra DSM 5091]